MTDTTSQLVDNSSKTTELYNTIYQSLVESGTIINSDDGKQNVDVLKSDFSNAKLRNLILMLLLANNIKLDSNMAFKLQSENEFALQQQLMENNGGRELSEEQNISFKKQEGSEVPYVNLLSELKIQANYLTFVFNRDTKSFDTIIKIAEKYKLELSKQLEYSAKTDIEKKEFINTQIQLTQDLCQKYNESLKEFTKNHNIGDLKSSIYKVINNLDDVIEIFNFIQDATQKEELKKSVNKLVGKFSVFAQSLCSNSELKEKIEQKKQLEEKEIYKQLLKKDKEKRLTEKEREELLEQRKVFYQLNQLPHIQVLDKIQRFSKQWNKVQEQTTQESIKFEILFDTRDDIRQCMDIFNDTISFTPDKDNNSYSDFILQVILPIIHQLAYTGIQNTNPELITKIISGQYDNIIQQRIAQLLNDALQNQLALPELTLNNLLDEDLVKVYDVAKLFNGLEEHLLTDGQIKQINQILLQIDTKRTDDNTSFVQEVLAQIKNGQTDFTLSDVEKQGLTEEQIQQKLKTQIDQICAMVEIVELARTTENPEVLKAIMEQEYFKNDLNILFAISRNENIYQGTLSDCIDALQNICENSKDLKIQKQCIDRIIEMSKNKNINQDILFGCIYALRSICENSKDSKIQQQCIDRIIEISRNGNINQDTLLGCIYALRDIYKNSKDPKIQEQCINRIIKISRNGNIDQYTLSVCIDALQNICENSKDPKIQEQCINRIIKISKNGNINQNTLSGCIYALRKIYKNSKDPKIQEQCINRIIEISTNENIYQNTLSGCIYTLRNIYKNSKDPKIQQQCINRIIEISTNENIDQDTLFGCIYALRSIYENSKDSKEIQKQCIDGIIEISTNGNINQNTLSGRIDALQNICENSKDPKIQQQCINRIIEISTNENIDQDTLFGCIYALRKIYENSKDSEEIQKQCIDGIIEISRNGNIDQDTLFCCICNLEYISEESKDSKCIDRIIEISRNGNINQNTLSDCIDTLRNIYKNSKDSEEIQEQCIDGIIEISKNPKADLKLQNRCKEVFNELSVDVSSQQLQNKTQTSDYTENEKNSPKSLFTSIDTTNVQPDNQHNDHVNDLSERRQNGTKKDGIEFGK